MVSAREDPKALYRATNKPQTDGKNCWSCCIKHVSCFLGLRWKPNVQNMLEHIPCSMQVPLRARKSLYARRASAMGNLKGFYLLKFREGKRTKCPSLHWPPFSGCCHFCTSAEHNLPPNWLSPTTGSPSSDAVCKGEKHGGALNKTSLNSLQECVSLFDVGSLASLGRYIDFMATEGILNFTAFSSKETHAWSEVGYFYSILVKCFLGLRIELFSAAHWLQIVNIFGLLKLGFIIYEILAFCGSKGAILINSTKLQNFWEAKALTSPHILCKKV